MAQESGWICESCGEVATGDLCVHCGRTRPFESGLTVDPGTYGRIYGFPQTSMAAWCIIAFFVIVFLGPAAVSCHQSHPR